MNTPANARTSNRIAAGVTATYLRNLSRHAMPPAASAVGGRRPAAASSVRGLPAVADHPAAGMPAPQRV